MFGARGEALGEILEKGMKVAVEGKLRWSQWERDGQKRSKLSVVVDELDLMSQRKPGGASAQPAEPQLPDAPSPSVYDEDIPF